MRLKKEERAIIKDVIALFDPDAKVFLFGSRIDKTKRGGDIDLLIESDRIGFKEIVKIKTKLFLALGDRSVDIVLNKDEPFVRSIRREAVEI